MERSSNRILQLGNGNQIQSLYVLVPSLFSSHFSVLVFSSVCFVICFTLSRFSFLLSSFALFLSFVCFHSSSLFVSHFLCSFSFLLLSDHFLSLFSASVGPVSASQPNFGGDGWAVWLLHESMDPRLSRTAFDASSPSSFSGSLFGIRPDFRGIGVLFDTYDNDVRRDNPVIFVLKNDEGVMKQYDHDNDYRADMWQDTSAVSGLGSATEFKCIADYRNTQDSAKVLIRSVACFSSLKRWWTCCRCINEGTLRTLSGMRSHVPVKSAIQSLDCLLLIALSCLLSDFCVAMSPSTSFLFLLLWRFDRYSSLYLSRFCLCLCLPSSSVSAFMLNAGCWTICWWCLSIRVTRPSLLSLSLSLISFLSLFLILQHGE